MAGTPGPPGRNAAGRVLRGAAPLAMLETLTLLLSFLLQPYLMRQLGPAPYGIYAVGIAAGGALAMVVDYGFNQLGPKEVARADADAQPSIFWGIQTAKLLLALVGTPTLALLAWAGGLFDAYGSALVPALLGVAAAWCFPQWFVQGLQRYRILALSLSAARLTSAAATVAWVSGPRDVALAIGLQLMVGPLAGAGLLADAGVRKTMRFVRPARPQVKAWLKAGAPLFFSTAAISLYTTCTPLIVGVLASPAVVGLFSAADKARIAGQVLLQPLTAVALPQLSRSLRDDRRGGLAAAAQVLRLQVALALALAVAIVVGAEWLMRLLGGQPFVAAVPTARMLGACLVFTALTNALGVQVMLPLNMDRAFAAVLALGATCGVAAQILLVPRWQERGAGAAVLITEALIVLLMAATLRQRGVRLREAG